MTQIQFFAIQCPTFRWRLNGRDSVSNHQPHDCLLNRLFRRRSKKTSKLRVTSLRVGNSPGTGEFPAQRASNAENVSLWWRHHEELTCNKMIHHYTPLLQRSWKVVYWFHLVRPCVCGRNGIPSVSFYNTSWIQFIPIHLIK